mgnify:FL=1
MTLVRNETQRYTTALKRAGQSPIGLLPFDGRRRLGGAIEDDAVDLAAFVGDARGDRGEHIVGDTGPVGGHGVFRADRAQDDRRAVGALVALDADRVNVSQKHDRHCQMSRSRPALESSSRAMASASRSRSRRSLVISPMMRMPRPGPGNG